MSALTDFPSVGLDELVERAALLTRVDRKYVLPRSRLDEVLCGLRPYARALEVDGVRVFGYASTYYDDSALTSFHLAAHGRRRRFKVRSRTYAESSRSYVEVKTRGLRGETVKQRLPLQRTAEAFDPLPEEATAFVGDALAPFAVSAQALRPVLQTTYRRSTLLVPSCGARVTVDTDLVWTQPDAGRLVLPDLVVLETKSGARASLVDRRLWAQGLRPIRISKYATGLSALDGTAHSNRWSPVLRRHFSSPTPPPDRTAS